MTDRHQSAGNRSKVDLSTVIPWTNESGETIPAYGVVQIRTNFSTTSKAYKPDNLDGLFFVNGMVSAAASAKGESYTWDRPRAVLLHGSPSVGDEVGPVSGQWYMDSTGSGFRVILQANDDDIGVVVASGGTGGTRISLSSGSCPCFCIDESEADIVVSGKRTTSKVVVSLAQHDSNLSDEPNGKTVLPANEHELIYSSGSGYWEKDIDSEILAFDLDGDPTTFVTAPSGSYIRWNPFASPDMELTIYWPNNLLGT